MAMKYSRFQHTECTTEQAEQLVADYSARGYETERSLNPNYLTWTVSVRRPEVKRLTPTPRSVRQRVWG